MQLVFKTFIFFLFLGGKIIAQNVTFPEHLKKTKISQLSNGDSVIYYQCHVETVTSELTTSTGEKIKSKPKKVTLTEKFVVTKNGDQYQIKYYIAGIHDYPNKLFAYLTLKETETWGFQFVKSGVMTEQDVLVLAAFETRTDDITYYDLKVNKISHNEVVIAYKKEKTQLIVRGDHKIKNVVSVTKDQTM